MRRLALLALALGALGEAALGGERGADLGPAGGQRPLVGRPAALLDQVDGVALGLARLVARAAGGPGEAVGLVARRVGGLDLLAARLDGRQRGVLGLRRALDLRDERVAPVALGEHAVLAAGGDLAQLARGGRPDPAVAGHRDAGEAVRDRPEVVDDPDAGEQRAGEPGGGAVAGADVIGEPHRAGRGRPAVVARVVAGRRDERGAAVAAGGVEQPRGLVPVGGHRGAQARAERSGERQLEARLGAQRVGQRGRAARCARLGAQELVDLGELGADAGGLAAGGLGGALELAPGAAGGLGGGVGVPAGGGGAVGLLGEPRDVGRGRVAPGLQLRDLLREPLGAILRELLELRLQPGDPLGGALVAGVLLRLGRQRREQSRGGGRRARTAS